MRLFMRQMAKTVKVPLSQLSAANSTISLSQKRMVYETLFLGFYPSQKRADTVVEFKKALKT